MTREVLLDNSAYAHLRHPNLAESRAQEVLDLMNRRAVAVCFPFLLEAGYSALNPRSYAEHLDEFLALPRYVIDQRIEDRALGAQGQLANKSQQRVSPPDLMIAALADRHRLGVLHYDGHYDHIREHTDLEFESVWLAPSGSL